MNVKWQRFVGAGLMAVAGVVTPALPVAAQQATPTQQGPSAACQELVFRSVYPVFQEAGRFSPLGYAPIGFAPFTLPSVGNPGDGTTYYNGPRNYGVGVPQAAPYGVRGPVGRAPMYGTPPMNGAQANGNGGQMSTTQMLPASGLARLTEAMQYGPEYVPSAEPHPMLQSENILRRLIETGAFEELSVDAQASLLVQLANLQQTEINSHLNSANQQREWVNTQTGTAAAIVNIRRAPHDLAIGYQSIAANWRAITLSSGQALQGLIESACNPNSGAVPGANTGSTSGAFFGFPTLDAFILACRTGQIIANSACLPYLPAR